MYAPLIPSNPITVTESSVFDKITKVVTIMFVFVGVLLTIIISILHGKINVTSNESEYNDQVGVIGYVAMNINSLPIKNVFFRDISCDASEETTKLFPWDNMNSLDYWQSQLLCIQRYKTMNYIDATGKCPSGGQQCGKYCVPSSEGSYCPITKLTIQPTTSLTADQDLSGGRGLYISRDTQSNSQGIYRLEVDVDTFPCQNDLYRNLGGLNSSNTHQLCDENGIDSVNSQRMEQLIFTDFLNDNMKFIKSTYTSSAIKPTSVAYLTARVKQFSQKSATNTCTEIAYWRIYDIQNYAANIDQIGTIYVIIKSIIVSLIGMVIIIELVLLKGKIHKDLKIMTTLLKILTIVLLTFFEIEGGLMIHVISEKQQIDAYFINFGNAGCFPQNSVAALFQNFPDLFSTDLQVFIQFFIYCMIVIAALESFLLILYIIQVARWCFMRRRIVQLQPRQFADEEFDKKRLNVKLMKEEETSNQSAKHENPHLELTQIIKTNKKSKKY